MWSSVIVAASAAIAGEAYKKAGSEALAAQIRMLKQSQDDTGITVMAAGEPRSKCPSCGSREFRQHAGRSVCSYCRSQG